MSLDKDDIKMLAKELKGMNLSAEDVNQGIELLQNEIVRFVMILAMVVAGMMLMDWLDLGWFAGVCIFAVICAFSGGKKMGE